MKKSGFLYFILFLFILTTFACQRKEAEGPPVVSRGLASEGEISNASIARQESKERFNALINKLDQRNPFSKEHEGIYRLKMSIGSLQLGGIFYDGKKPMAIINTQIVGVGDIVDEKQILKITEKEVVLRDLKEERIYKLEVVK